MVAGVFSNPALVAIPGLAFGLIPAVLAYRHSQKTDAIAEQAGIATVESGTIGQVIDGLNKIIAALQEDNSVLREDKLALDECRLQLADLLSRFPRAPETQDG